MLSTDKRKLLWKLLGDLPERDKPVKVIESKSELRKKYILESMLLDLNGIETVPAYFIKPRQTETPCPVILFNHSHGGFYDVGKEELLIGAPYLQNPPYAEQLTDLGYAVCCIDTWGFGQRHIRSEHDIFKSMLWSGQVMWGMMVFDNLRVVDYLCSRQDVDSSRIATLGMSMGGTMAWWSAALDERIKLCIDICSLTDYQALMDTDGLSGHGIYYYVPGLLKHFTSSEINALIAPRLHFSLAGDLDRLTPSAGLDRIDKELRKVYVNAKAPHAWRLATYPVGHVETEEMREEVMKFLREYL
jgi:pimeloyl-ACP methyl ester carboxylesterase